MPILYTCVLIIVVLFIPDVAYANFVWPALWDLSGLASILVIFPSLCIEYAAITRITKFSPQKSIIVTLVINVISFAVGFVVLILEIPAGDIFYLAQAGWAGLYWIPIAFVAAAVNVLLKWLAIRFMYKACIGKYGVIILYVANFVTVSLSFAYGQMYPMTI